MYPLGLECFSQVENVSARSRMYQPAEMEKTADAVSAHFFTGVLIFGFSSNFLMVFAFFVQLLSFLLIFV